MSKKIITIEDFIQEVLIKRFPKDLERQKIKTTNKGYNFACPICGDSEKSSTKKRGNLYLNSKTYKCWNDGCFAFLPLKKFVFDLSVKYNINILDLDIDYETDIEYSKAKVKLKGSNTVRDYINDNEIFKNLIEIKTIIDRFSLQNLKTLNKKSKVYNFLNNRKILDVYESYETIYYDLSDNCVYIFNYDKETNKILSFSLRIIDAKDKKYVLFPYSIMMEQLGIENRFEDIETIDLLGNYFNILNIDQNREVQITEGVLDRLFLKNSVAISGVSKVEFILQNIDNKLLKFFFDNDKAGKEQSLKTIQNNMDTFLWSLLIKKFKKKFNGNISEIMKIKDVNNLYSFLRKNTGINYDQFNELVFSCYGNSPFDIIYI